MTAESLGRQAERLPYNSCESRENHMHWYEISSYGFKQTPAANAAALFQNQIRRS